MTNNSKALAVTTIISQNLIFWPIFFLFLTHSLLTLTLGTRNLPAIRAIILYNRHAFAIAANGLFSENCQMILPIPFCFELWMNGFYL